MKLALSMLCENPLRRTGLSTLFHEFVRSALTEHPDISWLVFAGPEQEWTIADARVELVRDFPANNRRMARLWADHARVAPAARARGAAALLTVGFTPLRAAGLPVVMHVFTVHHWQKGVGPGGWYRYWAVSRGLRRAALVIVNSRWAAAHLVRRTAPLLVSYEGLRHDRFAGEGRRGAAGLPENYLLWVSNFYRYKRADLALAAYARLPGELRVRFPFVMIGGDWDGGLGRAREAARALGIGRDVLFTGWIADETLPDIYRGARAHVLSTTEETFGRSVTEAMACGCPCVLQEIPVLREVTDGAAVFTDFADSALAASALRSVCVDDLLAAGLRSAGLRRAAAFGFDKLARERLASILRVLAQPDR